MSEVPRDEHGLAISFEEERVAAASRRVIRRGEDRCHYCDNLATTRDHVVPMAILRRLRWPSDLSFNLVPACLRCNQRKGDNKSDCTCKTCQRAWVMIYPGLELVRTVEVIRLARVEDYGR